MQSHVVRTFHSERWNSWDKIRQNIFIRKHNRGWCKIINRSGRAKAVACHLWHTYYNLYCHMQNVTDCNSNNKIRPKLYVTMLTKRHGISDITSIEDGFEMRIAINLFSRSFLWNDLLLLSSGVCVCVSVCPNRELWPDRSSLEPDFLNNSIYLYLTPKTRGGAQRLHNCQFTDEVGLRKKSLKQASH
jgi:hypothetical protein